MVINPRIQVLVMILLTESVGNEAWNPQRSFAEVFGKAFEGIWRTRRCRIFKPKPKMAIGEIRDQTKTLVNKKTAMQKEARKMNEMN